MIAILFNGTSPKYNKLIPLITLIHKHKGIAITMKAIILKLFSEVFKTLLILYLLACFLNILLQSILQTLEDALRYGISSITYT